MARAKGIDRWIRRAEQRQAENEALRADLEAMTDAAKVVCEWAYGPIKIKMPVAVCDAFLSLKNALARPGVVKVLEGVKNGN